MFKLPVKPLASTVLICSAVLLSACNNSKDSAAEHDKIQPEDKIMQELITEPVKAFEKTPEDVHDIALLSDFDRRFSQMSDEMEDELSKMKADGTLTETFSASRKRDNIQSALNMLKALDLKTQQGRYIQGLMAEYWQTQAQLYDQPTESKTKLTKESDPRLHGLGEFLHAQEQLEHWQAQYPQTSVTQAHQSAS
ncbi:hypothetical protein [Acinetobacter harbinensis]|uniref:hypothetical protein n=1 Tax=Acinetobacter harbinensis TaxID=1353941 RepID=UPI0028E7A569|nr:hypothetical protein [Acinetobacter harbinensis]